MPLLNKKEIKIFLTFFIIYFYFVSWVGTNENTRLFLTRAIVDEGRFEIDSFYNQTGDRAYYNGHYYSEKAPGNSFLAVPIYATWKFIYNFFPQGFKEKYAGNNEFIPVYTASNQTIINQVNPGFFILISMMLVTGFTSSLFAALSVVLMYKISRYFTHIEKYRLLLIITYGLATTTFPYATVFLDEAVATFFLFLGFYLIFKSKEEKKIDPKYMFFAGLSVSLAILNDYFSVVLLIFYLILILFSKNLRNRTGLFILGLIIGIIPLLLYNYTIFNNPFELTRSYLDPKIYPAQYRTNFGFIYAVNPFIMYRSLFDPYRGLFYYYPILLLSFLGLYIMSKKYKLEAISIILAFLILTAFVSALFNWWGGSVFGPRYLSSIIPLLTLPLIYVFMKIDKNQFLFLITILLLLISITNSFAGLQNVEDMVLQPGGIETAPRYKSVENSFQVWEDPLYSHYMPLFIKIGPRSRIFESLSNGFIDVDIRQIPFSKGEQFPFDKFFIPFLSILPLLILIIIVWNKELSRRLKNLFNKWE